MFAVDDGLWAGNFDAADVLFLVALVVFVIAAALAGMDRPDPTRGALIPIGFALLSLAFLIQ